MTKSFKLTSFKWNSVLFMSTHTAPICLFLVAYFKDLGLELTTISLLLTTKKASRLLFDIPFGFLFDKFGAKIVFFISRLSKCLSLILLFCAKTKYFLLLGMLLNGVSYAAFYGKFNAYVFNVLLKNKSENLFHKIMSLCYLVGDFYVGFLGFIWVFLIKKFGYNSLFIISTLTIGLSSFLLLFLPSNFMKNMKQRHFVTIFKDCIKFIKKNPKIGYFSFLSGISNFLGWQAGMMISVVMLDMGFAAEKTGIFGVVSRVMTGICSFFLYKKSTPLSIHSSLRLSNLFLGIFAVLIMIYNKMFVYVAVSYSLFHLLIQIGMERHLESKLNDKIRGTITSFCWLICSLIAMFVSSLLSFKFVGKNYRLWCSVIMSILFFFNFFLSYLYLRESKINK